MWERRRASLEFSRMVRYESLRNDLLGPPVVHEAQDSSRSRCCLWRVCQLGHYCHPHSLHSPDAANYCINKVRRNLPDHFLLHMFKDLVPTCLSNPFLNLLNKKTGKVPSSSRRGFMTKSPRWEKTPCSGLNLSAKVSLREMT